MTDLPLLKRMASCKMNGLPGPNEMRWRAVCQLVQEDSGTQESARVREAEEKQKEMERPGSYAAWEAPSLPPSLSSRATPRGHRARPRMRVAVVR